MISALWNLKLYLMPTMGQFAAKAKPEDLIPYRFCPHLNGDSRFAKSYCPRHIAYMCSACSACHDYKCDPGRYN